MARKKRLKVVPQETITRNPDTGISESKFKVKISDLKVVDPLTHNQQEFFNLYRKKHANAFLLHGVAGTGKTYIAMYHALREVLNEDSTFNKVIIVRSAVPSRDIGHLPGTEKEKVEVYTQPYVEICSNLFPKFAEKAYMKLKEQQKIEFMVTSYVRGLTLDNAIVIVDELQNMTDGELNSIMTRVGENTKIIFCGDFRQTDLTKKHDMSGLQKFLNITSHMSTFRTVEFGVEDIVRSALVKEWIIARMQCEDLSIT